MLYNLYFGVCALVEKLITHFFLGLVVYNEDEIKPYFEPTLNLSL
jgi:hypothetical protein